MLPVLFAFLAPLIFAVLIGWRGGRDGPTTSREFLISAGWALAWGAAVIFLWHAIWLFSLSGARWGRIAADAGYWTLLSGALWLPVLMIAYVIRAQKRLKE